jgi:rhodanese-related sulfurtransferase
MGRLAEFISHHTLLAAGVLASLFAVLFYEIRLKSQGVTQIGTADAVRLINKGATVIDVRPAEQYCAGHIVNARNVELKAIEADATAVKKPKNKVLLLVCDNGLGSSKAAKLLRRAGFGNAFSLKSGLSSWRSENLPLVK